MTTILVRLNQIFILFISLTLIFVSSNEKEAFNNEITKAEELSQQNPNLFYCLVLSPTELDKEIITKVAKTTTDANQSVHFLFFIRKELHYPTVYLFHKGIIQIRKKVNKELMEDSFTSIIDYIHNNKSDSDSIEAIALISLTEHHFMNEDHLKKIIIAIIVVILLSITIVLITKYSIDWAISSRLDLNLVKDIRKKEALETLIEYTHRRGDSNDNAKMEYGF